MRMIAVSVVTVLFLVLQLSKFSNGKVYTKCGLTEELLRLNVPRSFVGNWVCLVENNESFKNTSTIKVKANGGKGLGIFQLNSKDWCKFKSNGGKCNMKCEDLTNEDISDDVSCAKKAIDSEGFKMWDSWKNSCKGRETVTRMPICPGIN